MKFPGYRPRTREELGRALAWAKKELHLQSWDIRLVRSIAGHPYLKENLDRSGAAAINVENMRADIGIQFDYAKEDDVDPIKILFHEMAHIACYFDEVADPDNKLEVLWEQLANRIAYLLCQLWAQ